MTERIAAVLESRNTSGVGTLLILLLVFLLIAMLYTAENKVSRQAAEILIELRDIAKPPEPASPEETRPAPSPTHRPRTQVETARASAPPVNVDRARTIASIVKSSDEPEMPERSPLNPTPNRLHDVDKPKSGGLTVINAGLGGDGGFDNDDRGGIVVNTGNGTGTRDTGDGGPGFSEVGPIDGGVSSDGELGTKIDVTTRPRPVTDQAVDDLANWLRRNKKSLCVNVQNALGCADEDQGNYLATHDTFRAREGDQSAEYLIVVFLRARTLKILLVNPTTLRAYLVVDERRDSPQQYRAGVSVLGGVSACPNYIGLDEQKAAGSPDANRALAIFNEWWATKKGK